MTLVEVLVALTILAVVLVGMGQFAFNFARGARQADALTVAVSLASQRLAQVRSSPNYAALAATYGGTESTIPGFPGFARQTSVVRTGGPRPTYPQDYQTVTVVVSSPGLVAPVSETVVIAAP